MSNVIRSSMGTMTLIFVTVLILLLPPISHSAAQKIVIVANKALGTTSISADDVARIFLGKKTTWPSGEPIVFAVFDDPEAQKDFMLQFLRKNPSQFKSYWKKLVFTGKGRMPQYLDRQEEVMKFVNSSPGAISFLPVSSQTNMKILNIKQ